MHTSARASVDVPHRILEARIHQMHFNQLKYGDMEVSQSSVLGLVIGNTQTHLRQMNHACESVLYSHLSISMAADSQDW